MHFVLLSRYMSNVSVIRANCMATKLELHIGERLRILRKQRGISLMKAGEIIEVSPQQASRLELAKNQMSASQLYRFTRGFNVPVMWFYEGFKEEPEELERLKVVIDENHANLSSNTSEDLDDALLTAWHAIPSKAQRKRVLAMIEGFAFGV